VLKVRTRNRAVTASANHAFMRLVAVDDHTEYHDDGEWPGVSTCLAAAGKTCLYDLHVRPTLHVKGMCVVHWGR
jgi:hypothetical protein